MERIGTDAVCTRTGRSRFRRPRRRRCCTTGHPSRPGGGRPPAQPTAVAAGRSPFRLPGRSTGRPDRDARIHRRTVNAASRTGAISRAANADAARAVRSRRKPPGPTPRSPGRAPDRRDHDPGRGPRGTGQIVRRAVLGERRSARLPEELASAGYRHHRADAVRSLGEVTPDRLGSRACISARACPRTARVSPYRAASRRCATSGSSISPPTSRAQLTLDPGDDMGPKWSTDGRWILFSSDRRGVRDIYRRPASGEGSDERVFASDVSKSVSAWSPDGRYAVYDTGGLGRGSDLHAVPLVGDRRPQVLAAEPGFQQQADFSPDGRLIAYASSESGRYEIIVDTFPDKAGRWKITTDGGREPIWRADGRELYFLSGQTVMAVDIHRDRGGLEWGAPRPLFQIPDLSSGLARPDGFSRWPAVPRGDRRHSGSASEPVHAVELGVTLEVSPDRVTIRGNGRDSRVARERRDRDIFVLDNYR